MHEKTKIGEEEVKYIYYTYPIVVIVVVSDVFFISAVARRFHGATDKQEKIVWR